MTSIVDEDQLLMAREIKSLYSSYQQNRDLINIGAYQKGRMSWIDRAIVAAPPEYEISLRRMSRRKRI